MEAALSPLRQGDDHQPDKAPASRGAVEPSWRATLRYAAIGAALMIPPYVLLFVCGRHPDPGRSDPWGWCLEAVVTGVAAGAIVGAFFGGVVCLLRLLFRGRVNGG